MTRAVVLVAAVAFCLSGCARLPSDWKRADSLPIASQQLEADKLACHGELTKATLAARDAPYGNDAFGYQSVSIDIYRGCMAGKGYLPISER